MKKYTALFASALLLAALAFVALAPSAHAHAEIKECTPQIDGVVETAPAKLICETTQAMNPEGSSLQVFDANGMQVDKGDSAVDLNDPERTIISVSLDTAKMQDGVYTVKWTTVSADDGDEASGEFKFTVGHAMAEATPTPAAGSETKPEAKISIVAPADEATLPPGDVTVQVKVEGVELGPEYHWHVSVDDKQVSMIMEGKDSAVVNLPEGKHEIKVALADETHTEIADAHVHVTVEAAAAATTLPATGGSVQYALFAALAALGALCLGAGVLIVARAQR